MSDTELRFMSALHSIRSANAAGPIWAALKEFAAPCGYTHLAAADSAKLASGAQGALLYTDAPDVAAQIDRAYPYANAPFVTRGIGSSAPFWISELREDPKVRGAWIDLLAEPVKRGDGYAVPVWFEGEPVGGAIFGGEKPDKSPVVCAMLQVLLHAAFARLRALKKGDVTRHSLTVRELQCLRFVALGKSDAQIGHDLGISSRTVRFHVDGAKTKLNATTRVQAIAKALQEKIIVV